MTTIIVCCKQWKIPANCSWGYSINKTATTSTENPALGEARAPTSPADNSGNGDFIMISPEDGVRGEDGAKHVGVRGYQARLPFAQVKTRPRYPSAPRLPIQQGSEKMQAICKQSLSGYSEGLLDHLLRQQE